MSELQKYKIVIVTNGDNRVATMMPDSKGRWLFDEDADGRIAEYQEQVVALREENRKLKVKAALYDAVEEAAHYLNDAEITLEIENGSVSVVLQQQRGTTRIEGADQSLAEQISEALDLAQPQE